MCLPVDFRDLLDSRGRVFIYFGAGARRRIDVNLIIRHVSTTVPNIEARNSKRIASFDGLEPRRCEDITGIDAPEIGARCFGTSDGSA